LNEGFIIIMLMTFIKAVGGHLMNSDQGADFSI
jgi:hypothetical protein